MPYDYEAFQAYAPTLDVPEAVFNALKPRAERWVARRLEPVDTPIEADEFEATSAYILHLIAELPASREDGSDITNLTLGDFAIRLDSQSYAQLLDGKAPYWLARAFQHLFDAGLERPTPARGAVK